MEDLPIQRKSIWICDLIKGCGFAETTSDAKRLVEQGAIYIKRREIHTGKLKENKFKGSWKDNIWLRNGDLIVGPRKVVKFIIEQPNLVLMELSSKFGESLESLQKQQEQTLSSSGSMVITFDSEKHRKAV